MSEIIENEELTAEELQEVEAIKAASQFAALEDSGVAFDPTTQHLDLTKTEKRRMTALMLATRAYHELIIKDAEYLREVARMSERDPELKIRPATILGIVQAAIQFDMFIAGKYSQQQPIDPTIMEDADGETALSASSPVPEKTKSKTARKFKPKKK
jgi:hypothetical protein